MNTATNTEPTFLYPKARVFPFDEVCEQIVRALEERNWNVPGISVDFDVYGSGAEKYRTVRTVKGEDFKLWFCRVQARTGKWNDTAAIMDIIIPGKELHVYDDESGPGYIVYTGMDWESDKKWFLSSTKVNSKLYNEPRRYLLYKAGCDCSQTYGASFPALELLAAALAGDTTALANMHHTHTGRRSPLLIHDNDLDREYNPDEGDVMIYQTKDVFLEFTLWLQENVLTKIKAEPIPSEKVDIFRQEKVAYSGMLGPIFCFGDGRDAVRVYTGQQYADQLEASDRYGMYGGYRLLPLNISNDGTVPDVAYEGFKWCGLGEVTQTTPADTLDVPGNNRWNDREKFVFRVIPNRADEIYVADNAPYEMRRHGLFEEIKPRVRLIDEEVAEVDRVRARTIVPVTEYTGGYTRPVVLVARELDLDEIELVSGPWPDYQYVSLIANHDAETRQLLERAISALEGRYARSGTKERELFDAAIQALVNHFGNDETLAEAARNYSREKALKVEAGVQFFSAIVFAAGESRSLGLF